MRFKFILLILILGSSFEAMARCLQAEVKLGMIKQASSKEDVSFLIDAFKMELQRCDVPMAALSVSNVQLEHYRHRGFLAQFEQAKEVVNDKYKYGSVENDVMAVETYARRLGVLTPALQAELNRKKAHGEMAVRQAAQTCGGGLTRDMSDKFGPVRDQGNLGWCFAFSAADLLSHRFGKRISAADVASTYYDGGADDFLTNFFGQRPSANSGGFAAEAMQKAIKRGLCLEDRFRSEVNGRAGLARALSRIERMRNRLLMDRNCIDALKVFPQMQAQDVIDIAAASARADVIDNLSNKNCAPRIAATNISTVSVRATSSQDKENLFEHINNQLTALKPIEISYNANILYSPDFHDSKLAFHSSVLVGRRFNPNSRQCEYLIRNSYGPGCEQYHDWLKCKRGNVWVPAANLAKGLRNVSYLK